MTVTMTMNEVYICITTLQHHGEIKEVVLFYLSSEQINSLKNLLN